MAHGSPLSTRSLHRLTERNVQASAIGEKDYVISDGGGLYLFVRQYGQKEWYLRFTSPITGQRRKISLGSYPSTTLKLARSVAAAHRALLDQNKDPLIEANSQRENDRRQFDQKRLMDRSAIVEVFFLWKSADLQNRRDNGAETTRAFQKDVFPIIGTKHVGNITRQDIRTILARPLARGSRRMANRLLADLKQFFGYAQDEELCSYDPTRRMTKARVGGLENPRSRVLSESERRMLPSILARSDLPVAYQFAVWLILATGCRVNELSKARWSDIDFAAHVFSIPREHAKNGIAHIVYLSPFAITILHQLRKTQTSEWLFPNRGSTGPIHRQTICKQISDRQRINQLKGRSKKSTALRLGSQKWTPHDLRRTAATIMQEIGIPPLVIKKCLNQTVGDRIIETYQRANLATAQRDAFCKLGTTLSNLVSMSNPVE